MSQAPVQAQPFEERSVASSSSMSVRTTRLAGASQLNQQIDRIAPRVPRGGDKRIRNGGRWMNNWTANLDFSGVAWDRPQAGTLITPRHIVFATHYMRAVGPIQFIDRQGRRVNRRVVRVGTVGKGAWPDLSVGLLDAPVPNSVAVYRIPEPRKDNPNLHGAKVIVTTNRKEALIFECYLAKDRPTPPGYGKFGSRQGYTTPIDKKWQGLLGHGDSGHPTFLFDGKGLVLMSVTSGGGLGGSGVYMGSPPVQNELFKLISTMR